MSTLFANYGQWIVFLHVLAAFVWVGGMIAIRIAVHPVIARGGLTAEQMRRNDVMKWMLPAPQRLGISLQITGRLFNLVIPFIVILFATGMLMAIATGGHHGTLKSLFVTKEIIWTIMTLNFAYMYYQRHKAWSDFRAEEYATAKARVGLIPLVLLPINIILGLVALALGIALRGL